MSIFKMKMKDLFRGIVDIIIFVTGCYLIIGFFVFISTPTGIVLDNLKFLIGGFIGTIIGCSLGHLVVLLLERK